MMQSIEACGIEMDLQWGNRTPLAYNVLIALTEETRKC